MPKETKAVVAFDESFAKLDVRVGRVTEVDLETRTHKPTYKIQRRRAGKLPLFLLQPMPKLGANCFKKIQTSN